MPRSYSEQFLLELHKANPQRAGVKLAKACVDANIPAQYVADLFGVSRMAVYTWFRGGALRGTNEIKALKLLELVRAERDKGNLPMITHAKAKEFINSVKPLFAE